MVMMSVIRNVCKISSHYCSFGKFIVFFQMEAHNSILSRFETGWDCSRRLQLRRQTVRAFLDSLCFCCFLQT